MNWFVMQCYRNYICTVAILAVTFLTAASWNVGVRDRPTMVPKRTLLSIVSVSTDGNASYTYSTEDTEVSRYIHILAFLAHLL